MTTITKSKDPSVTCAKATAIMLMVLCHAMSQDVAFVYMFHMPLFFFFSGYCLKTEYFSKPQVFAWRRVKGVYWPYLKWSVVFLLLHNMLFGLNIYNGQYGYHGGVSQLYGLADYAERLPNILFRMDKHDGLLGGYWFMRALFFGSLIAFTTALAANLATRKRKWLYPAILSVGGGILLAICCWLNKEHRTLTIIYVGPQSFLAAVFFIVGHLFKYLRIPSFKPWQTLAAFALVLLGSFCWKMAMHALTYDNHLMLPYILTAVLGTWAVYSLSWHRLTGRAASLMQFVGDNTLTILTWHFLAFKLVSLLIIYMYGLPMARLAEFPVITDYAVRGWWLAYFLVAMATTCAIAHCNRWLHSPWLKL